ncbi:hypothetical protein [Planotetraspora sp. GP83]|uniref:hypothetical protein n=1 Tax=Planotetraspora sp. GP83 TaxID=3156264 RepID=UPI00351743E5
MDRSLATAEISRQEVVAWLGARGADPRFIRFQHHIRVLEDIFAEMLTALTEELDKAHLIPGSGAVYERCAELDRSLLAVRRLFEWYAGKYDQRLDPRFGPVLAAADEVVRSCWREPFALLGRDPPTGPLAYVEPRFDASATPRLSVPPDLRAPADAVVASFVAELPIPVVCLPAWTAREAWWLVLSAHETGHHVLHDLGDLEHAARMALVSVAPDGTQEWSDWTLEAFADAYSVLMTGPAAAWAVTELQHGSRETLFRAPRPGDAYPPPVVRLRLMAEVARQAGLGDLSAWTAEPEPPGDATPPEFRALFAAVPKAAAALLGIRLDGRSLLELSGLRTAWFSTGGLAWNWARRLGERDPLFTRLDERAAARVLIAAGVAAGAGAQAEAEVAAGVASGTGDRLPPADRERVHGNLVAHLARCGPPGTMGAQPPKPQVAAVARRLAARLVAGAP